MPPPERPGQVCAHRRGSPQHSFKSKFCVDCGRGTRAESAIDFDPHLTGLPLFNTTRATPGWGAGGGDQLKRLWCSLLMCNTLGGDAVTQTLFCIFTHLFWTPPPHKRYSLGMSSTDRRWTTPIPSKHQCHPITGFMWHMKVYSFVFCFLMKCLLLYPAPATSLVCHRALCAHIRCSAFYFVLVSRLTDRSWALYSFSHLRVSFAAHRCCFQKGEGCGNNNRCLLATIKRRTPRKTRCRQHRGFGNHTPMQVSHPRLLAPPNCGLFVLI